MEKSHRWPILALVAGLAAVLMVTSAAKFFVPSVNTRNGVVYAYTPGKSITIRGFGRAPYDYSLTSNTQILPSSLASGIGVGAQVTVVGQCFTTTATSGCIALNIWVRTPVNAGSSASTSAPVAPSAPVATPTP